MKRPFLGAIVLYTFPVDGSICSGITRPAMIVRLWNQGDHAPLDSAVQLVVFVDGSNDGFSSSAPVVWKTSIQQGEPGQSNRYYFPEDA